MREAEFAVLVERHRAELRVHCYRMLGSLDEAEDLVQETFLRAWKHRDSFAGRSAVRAWLYRIATNACLDHRRRRRLLPQDLTGPWDPRTGEAPRTDVPWLQPFPDGLLDPATAAVERETIELAFLAAIQYLPPRQRAVLLLRDVLGWPASETAALLEGSVPAVNSALQRARAALKARLPARRLDWAPAEATESELAVLHRYMAAVQGADLGAVAELLAADVRAAMPPYPMWFLGRDAVLATLAISWDPASPHYVGRFRTVATRGNGRPAIGLYLQGPGEDGYRAAAISVLIVRGGRVAEMTAFHDPGLFPAFELPPAL